MIRARGIVKLTCTHRGDVRLKQARILQNTAQQPDAVSPAAAASLTSVPYPNCVESLYNCDAKILALPPKFGTLIIINKSQILEFRFLT